MPLIRAETTLCISLSSRPSNIGTRFHNFLYEELGLDFIYKAFSTTDIAAAIGGVRALGIRGCSVSMPFKEAVIPLVDKMEESAEAIRSVNTTVNDDGVLTASNTDYEAVLDLLIARNVDPQWPVLVHGSGGMAKAVVAALHALKFVDVIVLSRNDTAGRLLAQNFGFRHLASAPEPRGGVLINATPLGMTGADAEVLSFPRAQIESAHLVFDVVAFPSATPLIKEASALDIASISGSEVIALQAAAQFARYTGVTPSDEQIRRASAFSRAN